MGHRRAHVKTAYHHGNLRAELVTVALDIITRLGPDAATLRAVAKRLGVSQTAPYRHFPSKEALLAAVAADGFDALLRSLQAHLDRPGLDVTARYRSVGTAYVELALHH